MIKDWSKVYKQSYPWYRTGITHFGDDQKSWHRTDVYMNGDGIVVITLFENNYGNGRIQSTEFETIINGYRYRMTIRQNDLLERSLQIQAGKFLTEAIGKAKASL